MKKGALFHEKHSPNGCASIARSLRWTCFLQQQPVIRVFFKSIIIFFKFLVRLFRYVFLKLLIFDHLLFNRRDKFQHVFGTEPSESV